MADYGVDIYITEFDVRDDTLSDDVETRDKQVASIAGRFLDTMLRHPGGESRHRMAAGRQLFLLYGHRPTTRIRRWRGLPRPLPYDGELKRKPLWYLDGASLRNRAGLGAAIGER